MNMKRMRSRYYRSGGNNNGGNVRHNSQAAFNRNHVFDSNGPEGRVRGTANQLHEKYLQLGRDAAGAGDRVSAEGFFQHAEHYFRVLSTMNQAGLGINARPRSVSIERELEMMDKPDVVDQPDPSMTTFIAPEFSEQPDISMTPIVTDTEKTEIGNATKHGIGADGHSEEIGNDTLPQLSKPKGRARTVRKVRTSRVRQITPTEGNE